MLRARADIQRANPFGPVDFVCRKRHQVYRELTQVNRQLASALRSVDMQQCAVSPYPPADFRDVVDCTQFVVDQHQRDQKRIIAQSGTDRVGADQAIAVRCQPGNLDALFLKLPRSIKGCLVFDLTGDDMTGSASGECCLPLRAFLSHALERQIAGFGGTGGPDDLRGLSTYQTGNLLTGNFYRNAGLLSE